MLESRNEPLSCETPYPLAPQVTVEMPNFVTQGGMLQRLNAGLQLPQRTMVCSALLDRLLNVGQRGRACVLVVPNVA